MTTGSRYSDDEVTRTLAGAYAMLAPDTVLAGRYRIIEIAGAGGMGVVYKARDMELDTDVAVKLLAGDQVADREALERFRREIRLARQVSHPNVVRIHDIGMDGDIVFLTMDYVPARTLRERLTEGSLAPAQAAGIAMQLAAALEAAHDQGVVHRDIKPSNVLVDDRDRAWLTDFGVARSLNQEGLTRAGQVIGTLDYLAPEQVRGEDVDGRADLYALGLVLWEMLTGEVPLTGDTREETVARRATGRLPAQLPGTHRVPRRLRAIARRCLAPRPADRYPDAAALGTDLARGRAGINRRRWGLGLAAAVAASIVVFAIWTDWPGALREPSPPESPQRLAVLPLVNATGDGNLDWIRRALAETISAGLAESPGLQVTDPIRVNRTLADLRLEPAALESESLRQLGDLFAVDRIISGRLVGAGADLRLNLRVFGAEDVHFQRLEVPVHREGLLAGAEQATRELLSLLRLRPPDVSQALPLSTVAAALAGFDEGVAALAAGNRSAAITRLEEAVTADPDFGLAWLRLAEAYVEAGFYDEALDASGRAVELLDPHGGRASLWARARRASLAGEPERALERFARLVDRYPQDIDARLALGELHGDLGNLDAALENLLLVSRKDPTHPRVWFLLGKFSIIAGDPATAADDYLVRALVIQNRLANPEGRAEVLNALGIANEHLGRLDPATDYYRQAVELHTAGGSQRGLGASLSNLSRVSMIRGDFDYARRALQQALDIRRELRDLPGMAALHGDFGVLEEEAGHYPAALEHYRDALRLHEETGGGMGVAVAHTNLAFTYLMLGQYDTAEVFIGRAIDAHRQSASEQRLMSSLQIQAELHLARGQWDSAQTSLLEALDLARKIDTPFGKATIQGSIATLAWYQGRIGAALDAFGQALQILEPVGDSRGLAEYHLRQAEMMLDLEILGPANSSLELAEARFGEHSNRSQRARLKRTASGISALSGDLETAARELSQAAALAAESGNQAVAHQVELTRLRWIGGSVEAARELADAAARLGHRPLRLKSLELLARQQLDAGSAAEAHATVRNALRPPLGLEPWIGNWRLYELLALSEEASGTGDGEAAARQARERLLSLADGMPEELGAPFLTRHLSDSHVVAP